MGGAAAITGEEISVSEELSFAEQGRSDADLGVWLPPHANEDDPQDEDENAEYRDAWRQRRKELGPMFEWR